MRTAVTSPALFVLTLLMAAPGGALWAAENPHGDVFKNRLVPATVDFNRDVRPILSEKCYHCHGSDEGSRKAKLRLDIRADAITPKDEVYPIKPGAADDSEVMKRILTTDEDEIMPPPKEGHPLSPREIEIMKKWIAQGAPYAEHWAFVKPVRPPVPQTGMASPIDEFISANLTGNGLKMAAQADRHTLVRRLALDLTGLPPSLEEMKRFTQTETPIETAVDYYLAQPAFGERWARMWLDIARYADSAGYGSDPLRTNIWPYRDWVINAFNRNMRYDEFTYEQLAGDLMEPTTTEKLVATAFHRNTMTNTEGGTDDEEFRVAAVKDRISTTMQAWMGLTLGCAQCHTHKFDPITQQEYYEFFAIFNQTEDTDQPNDTPTLPLPTADQDAKTLALKAKIDTLQKKLGEASSPLLMKELAAWEARAHKGTQWEPLEFTSLKSEKGVLLEKLPDQSILAAEAESDVYTLETTTAKKGITAIKLTALPDDRLPGKGPGRSGGGNFVLSEFKLKVVPEGDDGPRRARFVRVALPGKKRVLHLAEVQVMSAGTNVALKGEATQSSTAFGGKAVFAVDGNTDGDYEHKSVSHAAEQNDPWWEVDLKSELPVDSIKIWNRTDGGTGDRTANFTVTALDAARKPVYERTETTAPRPEANFVLSDPVEVPFRSASADFEQAGYTAAHAIDGDNKTGWAIGSEFGKEHAVMLVAKTPVGRKDGATKLVFTLGQHYGANHTLGRFQIAVTTDADPQPMLPEGIKTILAVASEARTEAQKAELLAFYKPLSKLHAATVKELKATKDELEKVKPMALPVMKELSGDKRRESFFFNKGNHLTPGDKVQPALLKSFNPAPGEGSVDRLMVAKWLMSRDNPLTARVMVNRLWSQLFGLGLVETEEDFGTQGTLPTHPELLDWLALEFLDSGWNIKAMLKTMVMSATYQQSSKVTPEAKEKDSRNLLLSHYPRRRLDAEQVRDQGLVLSGLLSRKIGGPSVFPPQPDGLWRAAFNGQRTWETSKGDDRYRRGMYTFWRRTVPYPSMATFDAPSRENSTMRRVPTNTPLQAFVTLNDPAFFEMAQALGRRLATEGGGTVSGRVRFGLELCLARPATDDQVQTLVELYAQELTCYQAKPDEASKLSGVSDATQAAEMAAWTTVANVLLNLDGVLMKG